MSCRKWPHHWGIEGGELPINLVKEKLAQAANSN